MIYRLYYLLALAFILLPLNVISQKDSLVVAYDTSVIIPFSFDQKHLEEYKNDSDFDYREYKSENTIFAKIKRWIFNLFLKVFEWIFGHKKAAENLVWFFKILPYVVLGIVVLFLIKFFIKIKMKDIVSGSTTNPEIIYNDDAEIIRKKDIDNLIKEAIEEKNYRLALRYYYLKLLKLMEQNGIIEWEQQKTNDEYYKEIVKANIKSEFRRFTFWYDYVWYGNFSIDLREFSDISNEFDMFFKGMK